IDRPGYFMDLVPHLQSMRARTGRPHWLIVDEAHHLLPDYRIRESPTLGESIFLTVHPDHLARSILASIDVVIAVGVSPDKTLREFAVASGRSPPEGFSSPGGSDEVVCWFLDDQAPF